MDIFGGNRTIAMLGVLAALSLGTGCGNDAAPASGQPDSGAAGTSRSTVAPVQPADPATSPDASAPRPERGVFGRITAAGRPVVRAMVQPAPGPGNAAPEREVFALSTADGSYGIGLSPGAWDITISADGYQPVVLHVTVPSHGTVQANVRLDRTR
jgi:hypothetical protein